MRLVVKLLRAFVFAVLFFTLFAFALNNVHLVTVNGYFGHSTRAPLVLVVLASVVIGMALTMLAMLPGMIRRRRLAVPAPGRAPAARPGAGAAADAAPEGPAGFEAEHPPRVGL